MAERISLRTRGVLAVAAAGAVGMLLGTFLRSGPVHAGIGGPAAVGAAALGQFGGGESGEKADLVGRPSTGAGMMPGMMMGVPGMDMMGMGGQYTPPVEPTAAEREVVYVVRPPSAKAAALWAALGKPLDMPFPNETPLEDVLKYIKQATESEVTPHGIPIYVDPVGLMKAEQTTSTPVQIELNGIPLATTLRLMLRQLGLTYDVTDEGFLAITSETATSGQDPDAAILDELRALRREVSTLRAELRGGTTRGK